MRYAALIFTLFLFSGTIISDTIHVPGDFPVIQMAMDAAQEDDTVLVAPGYYVENIVFGPKTITVKSSHGAEVTIIDGGSPVDPDYGSVVTFINTGNNNTPVLDGFTLTNGTGTDDNNNERLGGGIYCYHSAAKIINNIITGCTASGDDGKGGGIMMYGDANPSARIMNNTIEGNTSNGNNSLGGGICWLGSSSSPLAFILGNTISGNSVNWDNGQGGGIACDGKFNAHACIENNIICENTGGRGGGIALHSSFPGNSLEIINNLIEGNEAKTKGGGIFCDRNIDSDFENNTIIRNSCGVEGGGICLDAICSPNITNNVIAFNTANRGGGIFMSDQCSPVIMNNTISFNEALGTTVLEGGGGICGDLATSYPAIINTILWGNTAYRGPELWLGGVSHWPSQVIFRYSNIAGGQGAIFMLSGTTIVWGAGMIDEDPLFVDAPGGDFHLTWGSPCINRGKSGEGVPWEDLDEDSRPFMGTVDMGADEFSGLHRLEADTFTLSETGGTVNFTLNAGSDNGGRLYFLLGSFSGTAQGFPLPGGQASIRINWDIFTDIVWYNLNSPIFQNFWVYLDPAGQGAAQLNVPPLPSGFVGAKMYYAYCLGWPWEFVSNPIEVEIVN